MNHNDDDLAPATDFEIRQESAANANARFDRFKQHGKDLEQMAIDKARREGRS